jgi:tetratricopeptide (TPR) repeat protein
VRRASGQADLETAADYYRKATQADPTHAVAWASLSITLSSLVANGYATLQAVSNEERAAAARALAIDPSLWQAHAAYQKIYDVLDWDFEAALKESRKRYELDPRAASNPKDLATLLFRLRGDSEEVRDLYRKALDLDPASPALFDILGYYYFWTGRFDEAESVIRRSIDLRPGRGQELLGMVLLARGEKENALIEIQREPDEESRLDGLAYVYHAMGRQKEAAAAMSDYERLYSAESPFNIARLYAYRQDLDKAFLWLDRAYARRDDGFRYLNRDSLFANLRGDPRYAALLQKLKLPP